jgi:hypothetical protein
MPCLCGEYGSLLTQLKHARCGAGHCQKCEHHQSYSAATEASTGIGIGRTMHKQVGPLLRITLSQVPGSSRFGPAVVQAPPAGTPWHPTPASGSQGAGGIVAGTNTESTLMADCSGVGAVQAIRPRRTKPGRRMTVVKAMRFMRASVSGAHWDDNPIARPGALVVQKHFPRTTPGLRNP